MALVESVEESEAESAPVQESEAASAGELEAASARELEAESAQAHRDTRCCQAKEYTQTQTEHPRSTRHCPTGSHSSSRSLLFRCEYVSG